MGLNDPAEMLEAAKAQSILDEREITRLRAELSAAEQLIAEQSRRLQQQAGTLFSAGEQAGILWRERHDLEQQQERLRALVREWQDAGLAGFPDEVLAIIGAQPAPSGDEHDRVA